MKAQALKMEVGVSETGLPLWKRALDCCVILMISPGILLFGAMVALLVKLGSPGPVFFAQRRVGYKGKEFVLFKFRTMRVNAETDSHRAHTRNLMQSETPMTKLDAKNDPRLIPFGALLRALGFDELPQLINVLRGEMSLVGPRPCVPYEYELYSPAQRVRFNAVPGLTGLWQVSGKNRTTFQRMVELDIAYVRQSSFWLDVKIMTRTLPALWCQWRDTRALRKQETAAAPTGIVKPMQSNCI